MRWITSSRTVKMRARCVGVYWCFVSAQFSQLGLRIELVVQCVGIYEYS